MAMSLIPYGLYQVFGNSTVLTLTYLIHCMPMVSYRFLCQGQDALKYLRLKTQELGDSCPHLLLKNGLQPFISFFLFHFVLRPLIFICFFKACSVDPIQMDLVKVWLCLY